MIVFRTGTTAFLLFALGGLTGIAPRINAVEAQGSAAAEEKDSTDQKTSKSESSATPYFTVTRVGRVPLQPTHLIVSIPLKSSDEDAKVAIDGLRQRRQLIQQTALDLGCREQDVHAALFAIGKPGASTAIFVRGRPLPDSALMIQASCVVVALFELEQNADPESLLESAQEKLQHFVNVLPPDDNTENDQSRPTYVSRGAVGIEEPAVIFACRPSDAQQQQAVTRAIRQARAEAEAIGAILGSREDDSVRVMHQDYSSLSRSGTLTLNQIVDQVFSGFVVSPHPDQLAFESRIMLSLSH